MPVSLDTKPRENITEPVVCVCDEQEYHLRRAAVFVGTGWAGGQPYAFWHGVRAGWSACSPVDDVASLACLCPPLCPLTFGVYKHTQGIQGKVAICAHNRGRHPTEHLIGVGRPS